MYLCNDPRIDEATQEPENCRDMLAWGESIFVWGRLLDHFTHQIHNQAGHQWTSCSDQEQLKFPAGGGPTAMVLTCVCVLQWSASQLQTSPVGSPTGQSSGSVGRRWASTGPSPAGTCGYLQRRTDKPHVSLLIDWPEWLMITVSVFSGVVILTK